MVELVEQFLDYLEVERGLSKNTILSYRHDLAKFISYLKRRGIGSMRNVEKQDILKYLLFLKDKSLAANSISRNLVAIKVFYRFLARERLIGEDIAGVLESPRLLQKLPDVLDIGEVVKILEAPEIKGPMGLRDRAALELMYATGMRVSEVVELVLAGLNLDMGFIRCMGKGGKERIVPLGKQASRALSAYLKKARPHFTSRAQDRHLFLSRLGKKISRQSYWKIIKK